MINNSTTVSNLSPKNNSTQLSFKLDHNISDRFRLAGSYIYTENPRLWVWDGGIWDKNDPNKTGGPLAVSEKQGASTNAIRFSPSFSFAPNVLNTTTFTYSRYRNPGMGSTAGGGWPEKLGFGAVFEQPSFSGRDGERIPGACGGHDGRENRAVAPPVPRGVAESDREALQRSALRLERS